jgi:hypothetical protein
MRYESLDELGMITQQIPSNYLIIARSFADVNAPILTSTHKAGAQGTQSLAGARGVLATLPSLRAGRRPARSIMSGSQTYIVEFASILKSIECQGYSELTPPTYHSSSMNQSDNAKHIIRKSGEYGSGFKKSFSYINISLSGMKSGLSRRLYVS